MDLITRQAHSTNTLNGVTSAYLTILTCEKSPLHIKQKLAGLWHLPTFTAIRKLKEEASASLVRRKPYSPPVYPQYANHCVQKAFCMATPAEKIPRSIHPGEKYAMHAVGIVSWFEFDSDVIDNQKLAALVMSVS